MSLFWGLKERLFIFHKIYCSNSTDAYFNLSLEEYLFHHSNSKNEILYLWQNDNTVVIGHNQNPWKECNLEELERVGGKLVRRRSGGGAVYHDLGNLNFTFISNFDKNRIIQNVEMVTHVLREFGIDAVYSGKNDIEVGSFKVSGNAYFEENKMLCHHGTLLCNTDIERLAKILHVSHQKLESKGIDSVQSRIKNIGEINPHVTVECLKKALAEVFWKRRVTSRFLNPIIFYLNEDYTGSEINMREVFALRERYESWDWNFGTSPGFNVTLSHHYPWGEVVLYLVVEDGIIKKVKVSTDALDVDLPSRIQSRVINGKFNEIQLINMLSNICIEKGEEH